MWKALDEFLLVENIKALLHLGDGDQRMSGRKNQQCKREAPGSFEEVVLRIGQTAQVLDR